jgi:hypothetical protein
VNDGGESSEAASIIRVRSAALGAISGLVLSAARAPLGIDWASIPATSGGEMALFGAVALLAVAAWLANAPRLSVVVFLWSVFASFVAHGLLLANALELSSHMQLLVLIAVATVGTVPGSITTRSRANATENAGASARERVVIEPGTVPTAGIAIAGFGAAWALYAVARPTLLLGGGLPQDDSVFASVFLLLVAFGATAFGKWFATGERARYALPMLLALTCAACFEPLIALSKFSERAGFESFLRSWPWSLDMLSVGMLSGDSLVGARVFVLPAFVLGAALACARTPRTLASLALGAALARASWPWFVEAQSASTPDAVASLAAQRVVIATTIAVAGASLSLVGAARAARKLTSWIWAGALVFLAFSWFLPLVWLGPRPRVLPLSPWEIAQPQPLWLRDTAEGLLTVELTHQGAKVVTLDRHRLTPLPDEEAIEAHCFERLRGHEYIQFVGQLTPSRAAVLHSVGVESVDRAAAWWRWTEEIETLLFGDVPRPGGEILDTKFAVSDVESRDYAHFVFATLGSSPRNTTFDSDLEGRPLLVWLDAASDIAHRDWGWGDVMLGCDGVGHLRIGIVNPSRPFGPKLTGTYASGTPFSAPTPLASLMKPHFARIFSNEARTTERLARATRGTEHEQLMSGLALHYAAQVESSPFETPAEQIELDDHALELMRDAALAREPDVFTRELWSGLARTLADKRDIDRIERHVKPLAERWKTWPELEYALAVADLEMLEPASAVQHIQLALEGAPNDIELHVLWGRALVLAEQPALAASVFDQALALAPSRRDIRRELAMARVRAGDPGGKAAVEALLREDSKDAELELFLGPGPLPAPRPALEPVPRHAEH